MALLYHFWQYRAYFSVRYCLKACAPLYLLYGPSVHNLGYLFKNHGAASSAGL